MGFKHIAAVAAAATAILGGVAAGTAHAATPSCGPGCIDIFSKMFGTFGHPAFILDTLKQNPNTGAQIILYRESNSDPAEDFTIANEGQVSDFFQAGLATSALNLHYGCGWSTSEAKCTNAYPDDYAFEVEYAPFGAATGECMGVAATAVTGEKVTLQPCGSSSNTVWVADTLDSCITNPLYRFEVPAINGSDTNFSHPLVLTYPTDGFPTDSPRPQLFVSNLTGFSQSGNGLPCGQGSIVGADSDQLWAAVAGVAH